MAAPIRLQLSRAKGFNLQAASRAANGLPVVNVARPGKFGNPFTIAAAVESGFAPPSSPQEFVVECFEDWIGPTRSGRDWWSGPEADRRKAAIIAGLPDLRGKNLACWCRLDQACHADVLLRLANAPVCEEA